MMPEGEDRRLRPGADRSVVYVLASTDESCSFGNVSGYGSFGGTVVDHDKRTANNKVVGDLSEKGRRVE
jgi:hypothetical protein